MQITLFYVPISTQDEASLLGKKAIDNRLAACVNIFPVQSIFLWEGSMQNENEFVLVLKTIPFLKDALQDFLSKNHPYEVPCIINWNVEVNDAYGKWMEEIIGTL